MESKRIRELEAEIGRLRKENADNLRRIQWQDRTTQLLHLQLNLAVRLNTLSSLTESLDFLLESMLESRLFLGGGLLLLNDLTDNFILAAHRGLPRELVDGIAVLEAGSPSFAALLRTEAVFDLPASEVLPASIAPELLPQPSRISLLPVLVHERLKAVVLLVSSMESAIGGAETSLLKGIAFLVGGVLIRGESEEALRRSLEEKEILLRELNHRVKNSLAMISSFLRLAGDEQIQPECRDVLEHLGNKVDSISLVYGQLYRDGSVDSIALSEYLRQLVPAIIDSLSDGRRFSVDLSLAEAQMDIDGCVAVGLIVTELITNTIKHAYPEGAAGRITLRLQRRSDHYLLDYRDFGRGLPSDLAERAKESLGIQLIRSFADRLEGELHIDAPAGRFRLRLPVT